MPVETLRCVGALASVMLALSMPGAAAAQTLHDYLEAAA